MGQYTVVSVEFPNPKLHVEVISRQTKTSTLSFLLLFLLFLRESKHQVGEGHDTMLGKEINYGAQCWLTRHKSKHLFSPRCAH